MIDDYGPDVTPPSEPSRAQSGSRWRSIAIATAAVAVAAVAIIGFLLVQSNSDKSDAEASFAESQIELEQATDRLAASDQESSDLQDQLAQAAADVAATEEDLAEMSSQLDQAIEVQEKVIDFIAVSISFGTGVEESDAVCMAESMAAENDIGVLLVDFADAAGVTDLNDPGVQSLGVKMLNAAEDCGVPLDTFTPVVDDGSVSGFGLLSDGDCFTLSSLGDARAVNCTDDHDGQVLVILTYPAALGSEFPGDQVLFDYGFEQCSDEFDTAVASLPSSVPTTAIDLFATVPFADGWADGDRAIVCSIQRVDGEQLPGG